MLNRSIAEIFEPIANDMINDEIRDTVLIILGLIIFFLFIKPKLIELWEKIKNP